MALKVGKSVDGWCTRCKLVLTHTIEAVNGEKITRVHCNTCKRQHAYRAQAPGVRAATSAAPKRAAGGRKAAEPKTRPNEYETLLRGRTAAAAQPYSTSFRYKVAELISHPTFGLGAVTGERDNAKIDVLFPDGVRVLVHGRRQ